MAVTLKDIARYSGVSVATVSQAINKKSVNIQTRERVLSVANKLGYSPSSLARSLRTKRSYKIGLVIGTPNLEFVNSVVDAARENGYSLVTQTFPENDTKEEWAAYENLLSQRVDGIIAWPSDPNLDIYSIKTKFDRHEIPMVIVDRATSTCNIPTFAFDNRRGALMAWTHLHNLGYGPIVYLDYHEDYSSVCARREGVRDAHLKFGVGWSDSSSIEVLGRDGIDIEALKKAIDIASNGGAILAAADHIAFYAMRLANQMGKKIPDDFALIGFEDVTIWLNERVGWVTSPPLTTVRMRFDQTGTNAVKFLVETLASEDDFVGFSEPITELTSPQLVVRKSCKGKPGIYGLDDEGEFCLIGREDLEFNID